MKKRRDKYVLKNFSNVLIRNTELSVYGNGRTILTKEKYVNKHAPKNPKTPEEVFKVWQNTHRPLEFFIDCERVKGW